MSATPVPGGCGRRVVVVDDSIVVRAAVRAMLQADPLVAMIETARSAPAALAVLERHVEDAPIDVVLLDVEMPSMSGIEVLPHLLRVSPTSRVVMASSLTRRGAAVTMAALAAGASDYSCKPQAAAAEARQAFAAELSTKVAIWGADARRARRESATPPRRPAAPVPEPTARSPATTGAARGPIEALAIASDDRWPAGAVAAVRSATRPLHLPDLHHPAHATDLHGNAGRADRPLRRRRLPRGGGRRAGRGGAHLCGPGDRHLEIEGDGRSQARVHLSDRAPENFCRPAVDPMLRSLAPVYRDRLWAVILTGMGQDGAAGAGLVRQRGGRIIVQDEASSVVWGMPGAVVRDGLADHVAPIAGIAALLRPRACRRLAGAA